MQSTSKQRGHVTLRTLLAVGVLAASPGIVKHLAMEPLPSDNVQYVSSQGNDQNSGLSWGSAKAGWAAAIDAANGGIVYIAPGKYVTNSQITVKPNVTVYAYGAQLIAGASFPTDTPLVNIGGEAQNDSSKLIGATLDCSDVPGCSGFIMLAANEQTGFEDITINRASGGCGSIVTTSSQNYDMGSLYCVADAHLSPSAVGVLIQSTSTASLPGTGNWGHWTIAGIDGHRFGAGIELYNIGGLLLQNVHCEDTVDCVLLTGSSGTGTNNIMVANTVGNSTVTNVIHIDSTPGNGNSVFLGITKNGATNTIKDDTNGVVVNSAMSSYSENAAVGIPQISMPAKFGTSLASQTLLRSAYASGQVFVSLSVTESKAGAGCTQQQDSGGRDGRPSSGGALRHRIGQVSDRVRDPTPVNTVVPTLHWTGPGGTAESIRLWPLSIVGDGSLDSYQTDSAPIAVKSGTRIYYTTTSVLNSKGCGITPEYTVYAKAIQ